MVVLGIESSCDETAASVVKDGKQLLSSVVFSSMDLHKVYGGVVPEIAARSHIESIIPVIDQALREAFPPPPSPLSESSDLQFYDPWSYIDAIAVTHGAGLGGSLLVGVTTAKELSILKDKPLYGINHVEAHVYASFLTETDIPGYKLPSDAPRFPLLALIVSGGHSQLVLFEDHFDYTLLGQTRDDAIGEAFDKVAKIIGLPYPGGPSIARAALKGDPNKHQLPKAKLKDDKYGFSFSGLKTAVLRFAQKEIGEDFTFPSSKLSKRLSDVQKTNIAASFQRVAIETVVDKTILAYKEFQPKSIVIAGGVAASQELRHQLSAALGETVSDVSEVAHILRYPDIKLCTDNGAMVATLGCHKASLGQKPDDPYSLEISPNLSM